MFVIYVRRDRALRIPYRVFALFRDILIIANYALNQGIQSLFRAYGASFFFLFLFKKKKDKILKNVYSVEVPRGVSQVFTAIDY